jgi:hypothetical protein
MEKQCFEKHQKYLEFYARSNNKDTEYWGLGIENESYLMFEELTTVDKKFIQTKQSPERYSVNYWNNYKPNTLFSALSKLSAEVRIPTYVNSYMFRNVDLLGEHRTLHGYRTKVNSKYSDESIDEFLRKVSPTYSKFFDTHLIYDGDTFEFTTYNFYKTNVKSVIKELCDVKRNILAEINKRLVSKFTLFKKPLIFPKFNYGFARFLSNPENIAICNNGTYHINLTLPTKLNKDGEIDNAEQFKLEHANAIRAIQWIEPLLVGLYGSPDILSLLDPSYAAGSQRLAFSRYIGLGTYDSKKMEKGKLLDTYSYDNSERKNYYTEMHCNSIITTPYIPPRTIGYDFNYNKFKKHGIELRIFDYFPEEHLEPIMNLIILVCQHSLHLLIPEPSDSENEAWTNLSMKAIKRGSSTKIVYDFYSQLYKVFGIQDPCFLYNKFLRMKASMLHVANILASELYKKYSTDTICKKMSPNMKPVILTDYNSLIKKEFKKLI